MKLKDTNEIIMQQVVRNTAYIDKNVREYLGTVMLSSRSIQNESSD
jgi:hypothetical protein